MSPAQMTTCHHASAGRRRRRDGCRRRTRGRRRPSQRAQRLPRRRAALSTRWRDVFASVHTVSMTSVRRHGRRRNTHPARTTAATTIDDDDDNDLTTMSSESEDDGDRRISRLRLPPVTARVAPQPGGAKGAMPRHGRPSLRLRCPASVTKLAMAKCRWKMKNARRRRDGSEPWTSTRRRYDTSSTGLRPPPLAAIVSSGHGGAR